MLVFLRFLRFYRIPIDDVLVNFEEIQLIHLQPDAITQGVALEEVRNCSMYIQQVKFLNPNTIYMNNGSVMN